MSANLGAQRTYLEEITHTANDANFAGSTYELQLLTKAWEKTAYAYSWPQTLVRFFDAIIAYVDRYDLAADFRKFMFIKVRGTKVEETDLSELEGSYDKYATALDSSEYLLGVVPTEETTEYSFSGSYTADPARVVTLDSVDGIAAGDEVYVDDGVHTPEFTRVQAVDDTLLTITVKLQNSQSNGVVYLVRDGIYGQYQQTITAPSASGDLPPTPDNTHLIIPHYAAYLYYTDIEEDDKAKTHLAIWTSELADAWQGLGKTSSGSVGEMTL